MIIIDGKKLAKELLDKLALKVEKAKEQGLRIPQLDIILVENDPASEVYVNMIIKKCQSIGLNSFLHKMPKQTKTSQVLELIDSLNNNQNCDGIIVQLPLPDGIDQQKVRAAIAVDKDVDSVGSANIGRFYSGLNSYCPCTAESMLRLLKSLELDLTAKKAVVVGRSLVVGRPIAELLLRENCTVKICHSRTNDLASEVKSADIVMAAVGKANLIDKSMLKKDAIVIDAGINLCENNKICGDVNSDDLEQWLKAITPVPGGVGPMTIAILLEHVIKAYESSNDEN